MLNRRRFLRTVTVGLLAAPIAAEAQRAGRIPTIGSVGIGPAAPAECPTSPTREAFVRGLRDRGYVPGQTIIVERRCYTTSDDLRKVLTEFVDRKVDVIVSSSPEAGIAASRATKTIPIVGLHGDPIGAGVASSLARPGGNVTGISDMGLQLMEKRLDLLKQVVPSLSEVAAVSLPLSPGTAATWREAETAATTLGIKFRFLGVRTPEDLENALASLSKNRPGALMATLGGSTLYARRQRLIDWALQYRVPTTFVNILPVREGALMSYGADFGDISYALARYVDKILKGTKPSDLPIEQPTKFEFAVNLKTAKTLGLTIPPSVLLRATEVIE